MLLDTSAIICSLDHEPEFDKLQILMDRAPFVAVGAPILDFRVEHQSAALEAFLRFGKVRHPAYKGNDFGLTDLPFLHRLDA